MFCALLIYRWDCDTSGCAFPSILIYLKALFFTPLWLHFYFGCRKPRKHDLHLNNEKRWKICKILTQDQRAVVTRLPGDSILRVTSPLEWEGTQGGSPWQCRKRRQLQRGRLGGGAGSWRDPPPPRVHRPATPPATPAPPSNEAKVLIYLGRYNHLPVRTTTSQTQAPAQIQGILPS